MKFKDLKYPKPTWWAEPEPAEEWAKMQALLEAQHPSDFINFFVSFIAGIIIGCFAGGAFMYQHYNTPRPSQLKPLSKYHPYVKDENITMRNLDEEK